MCFLHPPWNSAVATPSKKSASFGSALLWQLYCGFKGLWWETEEIALSGGLTSCRKHITLRHLRTATFRTFPLSRFPEGWISSAAQCHSQTPDSGSRAPPDCTSQRLFSLRANFAVRWREKRHDRKKLGGTIKKFSQQQLTPKTCCRRSECVRFGRRS